MIALHGRARPLRRPGSGSVSHGDAAEWPDAAQQLAECLVNGSEQRGAPAGRHRALPLPGPALRERRPTQVMERLRPLAQRLRIACGALDVPVVEALCVSAGRWWSYCCPDPDRCPR